MQSGVELRRNAISGLDSTLIAVSAMAPANTIATSTAALVAAVGMSGPGALLFCAIPMFGIALAYFYLNMWRSDAGAAYVWVGRSVHPVLGFFAGWSLLVALVLFVVAGSLPVASASLDLIAPHLSRSVFAVSGVGFLWFLAVVAIVLLGIKTTAQFQKAVTLLQIGGLLLFAAGAIAKGISHPVNHVSWSWLLPVGNSGLHSFVAGALIALFYFWGWDVSANLTEETVDRKRTPGLSGIGGMLIILALFVITAVGVQLILSPQAIADAGSDLLVTYANAAVPRPWSDIAVIVVIISAVGSLETSMVQGGRTMFSMGRDGVLDERFARLDPRFLTPWSATFALAVVAAALYALAATSTSVIQVLKETISAIGVMIAVYYGLSGLACAWYYRIANRTDNWMLLLRGVYPVLASLFVFWIAALQLMIAGWRTDVTLIGLLLVGLIPMLYYRRLYKSEYYALPPEHL